MPSWYTDRPEEDLLDCWYLESFWDLNTTRNYEMGPIPWHAINTYGANKGLVGPTLEAFIVLIRVLDYEYLNWHRAEQRRLSKA